MTNIIGCAADELRIGERVEAVFEVGNDRGAVARFRRRRRPRRRAR